MLALCFELYLFFFTTAVTSLLAGIAELHRSMRQSSPTVNQWPLFNNEADPSISECKDKQEQSPGHQVTTYFREENKGRNWCN